VFDKSRDQRHDWQIYRELARRITARLKRKAPLKKRVLNRARLSMSPTFLIGQLLRTDKSGVQISDLRRNPSGVDLGPLQPGRFPERLFTPGKRIDAAPELVHEDLARLAEQELPSGDDLLLIGRRHQSDNNSWMHNATRLTRGRDRHQLLMHPEDLAARDIEDGKTVKVTSRVGSVEVEVLATNDMMRGVVSLPHGYGHQVGGRMTSACRVVSLM
jgi:anaerobic selenocysteine-containing dehydrogenase